MKRKNEYSFHINYPVRIADTFISRFTGLMGRKEVDYGLFLSPCKSIHTFFMKIPIDVVYLDEMLSVLHVQKSLTPWKISGCSGAVRHILELPAGVADKLNLKAGDHI